MVSVLLHTWPRRFLLSDSKLPRARARARRRFRNKMLHGDFRAANGTTISIPSLPIFARDITEPSAK